MAVPDALRLGVPELLFQPGPLRSDRALFPNESAAAAAQLTPVQELVVHAINRIDDVAQKMKLYRSVVLCGGGAKFAGIEARLLRELTELVPGVPTIVVANPPGNRALAPWLGGSLVAALPTFDSFTMTKAQYVEHGAAHIQKRCA